MSVPIVGQPFPQLNSPMVDPSTGMLVGVWSNLLTQLWLNQGGARGTISAPAAGNGNQVFSVANAVGQQQAIPLGQADARYAALAGSQLQPFFVGNALPGSNMALRRSQAEALFSPAGAGGVVSVSGTAPVVSSGGATPAISMAAATTSVPGYLLAADWNTFNGKVAKSGDAMTGGLSFGSAVASSTTDLSRHVDLYGGTYGFGVTGSSLNYNAAGGVHNFLVAGVSRATVGVGGLTATNLSGTNTGDQTITLTGDVTGAGTGSFAATIGAGKVTLAKQANLAANSIIGNNTGAAAVPVALTVAQAQTLLGITSGTFVPTVVGTTTAGVGTYTTQLGKYVKTSNMVAFKILVSITAHTGTGNLRIGALPFTSNADGFDSAVSIGYVNNLALTAGNIATAIVPAGSSQIALYQVPTGGGATVVVPMDTSFDIEVAGFYFT